MLVYQKTMLDRYYCILENFGKNASKSSFLHYYYDTQKHDGFVGFEKACSIAKTYVILTSLNYVQFYARYH